VNGDQEQSVSMRCVRPSRGVGPGTLLPGFSAREISPATAEQMRALRVSGHGYKAIAQMVGDSRTTVRRMLKGSNLKVA
jgi:DNA invertase Pin-like site-specific DNA recombinase